MARDFAVPQPIVLPLRTTWEEEWQLLETIAGPPVDLTGYEARMQVRDRRLNTLVHTLDTTTNGGLTLDTATSTLALRVDAADVAAMSPDNERRKLHWDCELYLPATTDPVAPEVVIPLFSGVLLLTRRVTQP